MSQDAEDAAQVPDLLQLVCFEGPCEGVMFSKPSTVLTVGRTNRSKICVKDPSVSEKHAKIEWSDDTVLLNDLDIIQFGDSKLRVQVTPVPADSVTVEQYLRAECNRYEKRVTVKLAQISNQLTEEWKAAKRILVQETLSQA